MLYCGENEPFGCAQNQEIMKKIIRKILNK